MNPEQTALILIGFQNDYFSPEGVLHSALEAPERVREVESRTIGLVRRLAESPATIVSTPILFTEDYRELVDPVGILKAVRDARAFRAGTRGGETIPSLRAFGDRILEVPGKRGLNAFSNTELDAVLRARRVRDVVLAGVVTSICVDSTGRAAAENGYRVTVLSDCTAGRTALEQDFYCGQVFPLYARVLTSTQLTQELAAWLAVPTPTTT